MSFAIFLANACADLRYPCVRGCVLSDVECELDDLEQHCQTRRREHRRSAVVVVAALRESVSEEQQDVQRERVQLDDAEERAEQVEPRSLLRERLELDARGILLLSRLLVALLLHDDFAALRVEVNEESARVVLLAPEEGGVLVVVVLVVVQPAAVPEVLVQIVVVLQARRRRRDSRQANTSAH